MTYTFNGTDIDNTIDDSVKDQIKVIYDQAVAGETITGLMMDDEAVTRASDDETFDTFFERILETKGGYRRRRSRRSKRSRRPRKSRRPKRSKRSRRSRRH
jgi:hypothetical protein